MLARESVLNKASSWLFGTVKFEKYLIDQSALSSLFFFLSFFLTVPPGMQDLSSLARNQVEVWSLNKWTTREEPEWFFTTNVPTH